MKKKPVSRIKKRTQKVSLTLLFSLLSFCVLLVAILLAWGLVMLLIQLNVFEGVSEEIRMSNIVIVMSLTSLASYMVWSSSIKRLIVPLPILSTIRV